MLSKKTYYSISEVSKIIGVQEHTIRFWDSKLPGISKQAEKGKTRFFSVQQINKLEKINNLLKNNDSLSLAFEIASKNNSKNTFLNSSNSLKLLTDSSNNLSKSNKIEIIINNLKYLLDTK